MQDVGGSSLDSQYRSVRQDIPRRARIEISPRRADFLAERAPEPASPSFGSVAGRLLLWSRALTRFAMAGLSDRLRSRYSRRRNAVHLREMLQSLGGTGI